MDKEVTNGNPKQVKKTPINNRKKRKVVKLFLDGPFDSSVCTAKEYEQECFRRRITEICAVANILKDVDEMSKTVFIYKSCLKYTDGDVSSMLNMPIEFIKPHLTEALRYMERNNIVVEYYDRM